MVRDTFRVPYFVSTFVLYRDRSGFTVNDPEAQRDQQSQGHPNDTYMSSTMVPQCPPPSVHSIREQVTHYMSRWNVHLQ